MEKLFFKDLNLYDIFIKFQYEDLKIKFNNIINREEFEEDKKILKETIDCFKQCVKCLIFYDAYFEKEEKEFKIKSPGFYKTDNDERIYISKVDEDAGLCYGIAQYGGERAIKFGLKGENCGSSKKLRKAGNIISKWTV